jgi:hypothetical protein
MLRANPPNRKNILFLWQLPKDYTEGARHI